MKGKSEETGEKITHRSPPLAQNIHLEDDPTHFPSAKCYAIKRINCEYEESDHTGTV